MNVDNRLTLTQCKRTSQSFKTYNFVGVSSSLLLLIVMVLALPTPRAHAQMATAQITGIVHDQTSAIVPGAQITVTQTETGFTLSTISNAEGLFNLPTLPLGPYTISVKAQGFEPYRQIGRVLTVGQHFDLTVELTIGHANETVNVTADTVSVDGTTPTEQSTVEQKVVQDLPLNGRNPASLTFTVAGVTDATLNESSSDPSSTVKETDVSSPSESAPSVHGARPGGTYFSLDGANNTDPFSVIGGPFPNPDATGEFSVVTGTYGARYVSAPGGAINIVTKSGTNEIHGSVFEFIRNGYFNARNALSDAPDVLKRNQFGFALGAPIVRNRLFAFASYQATPTHNSVTATGYLPTAAERTGNFGTFTIPSYLISPIGQKLLTLIPSGDPTTGYLSWQEPQPTNDQQAVLKLDFDAKNHRIFARGFYDRFQYLGSDPTPSALMLGESSSQLQPWTSFAVGDTWTHHDWIFDSRASIMRALATQGLKKQEMSDSALGISGISGYGATPGIADLLVIGGFSAGPGAVTHFPRTELEFSENAYVIKGKHQVSFGAEYRNVNLTENNFSGEDPVLIFTGVNAYIYGLFGIIPGATTNAYADLLMAAPLPFYQKDGFFSHQSGNLSGLYGEDNYRITSKLTATGGLRWDPYVPYKQPNHRITCYNPGHQSTVFVDAYPGLLFPGDSGCPDGGMPASLAEFEPRVGLAYQVGNSGKTVIRAGYGIYDLQFPLNAYTNFSALPWGRSFLIEQPFLNLANLWASAGTTNPFASGFQTGNYNPPSSATFLPGLAVSAFSQNFKPGYVQQWSLSVQREITSMDSIDVAYVGATGIHLTIGESANTAVYDNSQSIAQNLNTIAARMPNTNFGNVGILNSDATSSYNGLDATWRHRSRSFTFTSAFSWSKAIDDDSQPVDAGTVNVPILNDHNFRRGLSDYDQNLTFRTTATWNSPTFADKNAALRTVIGSWALAGLLVLDAGQPFSVSDGSDFSATGLGLDLANRVPGVPTYVHGMLNLNAFTDNAPNTYGNSGRNSFRGPSNKDVDIAASKDFPVWERVHLTFRAEAFNLLNHPNYLPPNSGYGDPGTPAAISFGQYATARDPRVLQFSVKFSF